MSCLFHISEKTFKTLTTKRRSIRTWKSTPAEGGHAFSSSFNRLKNLGIRIERCGHLVVSIQFIHFITALRPQDLHLALLADSVGYLGMSIIGILKFNSVLKFLLQFITSPGSIQTDMSTGRFSRISLMLTLASCAAFSKTGSVGLPVFRHR